MFIFPDAEPFNQILGALEFGVKAIFLPFESCHILHRYAEKKRWNKSKHKGKSSHLTSFRAPEVTAAFWYFNISETVCKLNGKERFDLLSDQCRVATPHGPLRQQKSAHTGHRVTWHKVPLQSCHKKMWHLSSLNQMARLPWAPTGGDILPARGIFRPKQEQSEEKTHPRAIRASSSGDTIKASASHYCYWVRLQ